MENSSEQQRADQLKDLLAHGRVSAGQNVLSLRIPTPDNPDSLQTCGVVPFGFAPD